MKKALSLLITGVLFLSFSSNAQDTKAKAILDKVSTKIKGMSSIKANFALTMSNASGKQSGTKKGTFLMKGNKYKVDLTEQKIICDGKSVWTYLPANKEVQVSSFNPNEQTISPAKLFSGSYNSEYKSTYVGEKTVSGKKVDVVEMIPVNNKSFKKVQLYIDKSSNMISGGNMTDKNGGTYAYSISGVSSSNVPDAEFTFDTRKHPDVEVIDLR